jgi:glycine cleavage system regulatory protein
MRSLSSDYPQVIARLCRSDLSAGCERIRSRILFAGEDCSDGSRQQRRATVLYQSVVRE